MILLPAIDMKDGKVVRLYKGDFDTVHQVAEDPVATAKAFYDAGARWIHMVDLDGAKDGTRKNGSIVQQVSQVGLKIELGGGIRTMADLEAVFAMGVTRAVIGSAAVTNPEFVEEAVKTFGERIAVGIDIRDGYVAIRGWTVRSEEPAMDFCCKMQELGVKTLICTDISRDGAMMGANHALYRELSERFNMKIIASGGVSSMEDVEELRKLDIFGAIIGKAYYTVAIDLRKAIEVAK